MTHPLLKGDRSRMPQTPFIRYRTMASEKRALRRQDALPASDFGASLGSDPSHLSPSRSMSMNWVSLVTSMINGVVSRERYLAGICPFPLR